MARRKIGRDQLIEKAGYLFRTRGYANTSIADIANACGLSKASIYHHITSKQELATKVIAQLHEYFEENIFAVAYESGVSLKTRANNFITAVNEFFTDRDGGCLMGNFVSEVVDTHPEFHELFVKFFNEWTDVFANLLTEKYPQHTAKNIAQDIIAQLQGAILLSRLYKSNTPIKRTTDEIIALFADETGKYQMLASVIADNVSEPV